MINSHRQWFNSNWSPAKNARFLQLLQEQCGEPVQFRHSETPCFLAASLVDKIERYGREMTEQIVCDRAYLETARAAIPEQYRVPNEPAAPLFVQADFGLDQDLEPKLVEIQGFPSLYAYQPVLSDAYREAHGLPDALQSFPNGIALDAYKQMLREAIVGSCDPENVVLLEVDPANQKTRHDFLMTERWFSVRTVDIREVTKRGNRLFHGKTPIHRIYNRTIIDELERRRIEVPFDFRDDLQLEWAGHPNWFFLLSKFSLPYLQHAAVPETRFVETVSRPERFVLKPLYSFAGVGVVVGPTQEQIAAASRRDHILQERVDFRPVVDTPHGPTKIEIRVMYLWREELTPVNLIIRMGRGAQMGVDHNKGLDWVGASAAFIDPGE